MSSKTIIRIKFVQFTLIELLMLLHVARQCAKTYNAQEADKVVASCQSNSTNDKQQCHQSTYKSYIQYHSRKF